MAARAVQVVARRYLDSIALLALTADLSEVEGITDAAVAMATPDGRDRLRDRGYIESSIDEAGPNDLVLALTVLAVEAALAVDPVVTRVLPAGEVIAGLGGGQRRLHHAGPPIAWPDMCGPMRGALIGAALAEGWAAGIAHREAGVGQIGAGITHAPWECFRDAIVFGSSEDLLR